MSNVSTTTPAATSTALSTGSTITNQASYNAAYTQFLSMLTTELQNQDPTSPMDTSQFTSQLVGFSQLEQQLQTNSSLNTLVSDQQTSQMGTAIGYLGHTVTATGSSFTLDGTDPVQIGYSLPSTAATATLNVTDATGATVRSISVSTSGGSHTLSFTGADDSGDSALPAGTYNFSISAADSSGNAITTTTYTTGTVSGVDSSSGTPVLQVGGQSVQLSAITAVGS
jgi:flagellar basal-body rod modification protein FlgD